jgi:hypothetical protein
VRDIVSYSSQGTYCRHKVVVELSSFPHAGWVASHSIIVLLSKSNFRPGDKVINFLAPLQLGDKSIHELTRIRMANRRGSCGFVDRFANRWRKRIHGVTRKPPLPGISLPRMETVTRQSPFRQSVMQSSLRPWVSSGSNSSISTG